MSSLDQLAVSFVAVKSAPITPIHADNALIWGQAKCPGKRRMTFLLAIHLR
jgi:hypothetical protein